MTRKLLTVDEFRALAQRDAGTRPEGTVLRFAVAEPEVAAKGTRKRRFVFSDGSVDRAGDRIDPAGWQTEAFMRNPVALWAHDSFAPPIGRASNVGRVGDKLKGDVEFMPADISPFADSVLRMIDGGFVRAVSVGFIPLKWSFSKDKDRPYGVDFEKQELIEISVCPVPCNPNALQDAKSLGIDVTPIREWAERLLDAGGQVMVPRKLLEETFRQAKTPIAIRRQFVSASKLLDQVAARRREAEELVARAKKLLGDETTETTPAGRLAEVRRLQRLSGLGRP